MSEIIELLEDISENRIFHEGSMDQNTSLELKVAQMIEKLKSNSDYAKCTNCGYETVPMVYCPHCNGYITVPNKHFA